MVVFLFPSCRSESLSYPIQILPEREFKIHFPQVQEFRGFKPVSVCEYTIKTLPYCCLLTIILKGLCMQHVSIQLRSKEPTENWCWYHLNISSVCCSHPSLYRGMSALCIESPVIIVEKNSSVQTPPLHKLSSLLLRTILFYRRKQRHQEVMWPKVYRVYDRTNNGEKFSNGQWTWLRAAPCSLLSLLGMFRSVGLSFLLPCPYWHFQ